jgi:hypothetical protein
MSAEIETAVGQTARAGAGAAAGLPLKRPWSAWAITPRSAYASTAFNSWAAGPGTTRPRLCAGGSSGQGQLHLDSAGSPRVSTCGETGRYDHPARGS